MAPPSDLLRPPLRPSTYHILLALVSGDLHGLGIADEVLDASEGAIDLGPGTLYRALSEMTEAGLIRPVGPPSPEADPRRKYYGITPDGRELVGRESLRLSRLVEVARSRNALPEGV